MPIYKQVRLISVCVSVQSDCRISLYFLFKDFHASGLELVAEQVRYENPEARVSCV